VLGTLIITLWFVTRADLLEDLGFLNILLGLVCTLGGVASLLYYVWTSVATHRRPAANWLLRSAVAGALLIGNFPLCGYYLRLASMHSVRVVNATGTKIDSFIVADARGGQWELGPIPAGGRAKRLISINSDGPITFRATGKGATFAGTIEPYLATVSGKEWTVTLNPDGSHTVR